MKLRLLWVRSAQTVASLLLLKGWKSVLLGSEVASPEGEQEGCANPPRDAGQSSLQLDNKRVQAEGL